MYSFSKLTIYDTCPQRYKFKYIDKVKIETPKQMKQGLSFHKFAESFYKDLNKVEYPIEYCDKVLQLPDELLDKTKKNFVRNEAARLVDENVTDRFIEQRLVGEIENYEIIGYADLIEVRDNNSYTVIDFKKKKPSKITTLRRQLYIYQTLFEQSEYCLTDEVCTGAYFYATGDYWFEKLGNRSIGATKRWIKKNIEAIESDEEFKYKASAYTCKWCEFNSVCKNRIV